jgi:hypothetical protein
MESATATWTGFRQRSLNAAISILALSLSGWAQQAPSSSQKHQGAKTHSGTVEYKDTKYGLDHIAGIVEGLPSLVVRMGRRGACHRWNGKSCFARTAVENSAPKMDAGESPRRHANHHLYNRSMEGKSDRECGSIRSGRNRAQRKVYICDPAALELRLCRRMGGSIENLKCKFLSYIRTSELIYGIFERVGAASGGESGLTRY